MISMPCFLKSLIPNLASEKLNTKHPAHGVRFPETRRAGFAGAKNNILGAGEWKTFAAGKTFWWRSRWQKAWRANKQCRRLPGHRVNRVRVTIL